MDLSAFHNQFREETSENIRVLSDGLLALEGMPDHGAPAARERIDAIFRAVHTVKGSARLLGFESIGKVAHTMEHILGAVREGQRTLDRALADELLRGGDAILELTAAVIEGRLSTVDVELLAATLGRGLAQKEDGPGPMGQAPPPGAPDPSAQPEPAARDYAPPAAPRPAPAEARRPAMRQTVRVRVDRLDRLINLAGELVVAQQVLSTHVDMLQNLRVMLAQHERSLASLEAELRRLRFSPLQRQTLDQYLGALSSSVGRTTRLLDQQLDHFPAHVDHHRLLVDDLEQEVMTVRLLPIGTIFGNLPRAVRDLANATGKDVALEIIGEATEIDRKLLETLNDPLLHLVRNAVDHGIEPPDERAAAGKARAGLVRISAETTGGEVRIIIADDGRGMDTRQLREAAVRKRLLSAENAAMLTDHEALELIFLPGFSTAPMITDISGRGVGMDVAHTNIGELGGQILIDSQPGQGTQITLLLPLTLVTTRVLIVQVGSAVFALPASGCRGTLWTYRDQIRTLEGQATILHEERTIPLLRLADLLHVPAPPLFQQRERMPTVLIATAQRALGLLVDDLLDEREAVIKPLGPLLDTLCHSRPAALPYSGALQPGDGSLVLLLNPGALVLAARGLALAGPAATAPADRKPHLLVVDDSFTTRELVRSILQSAGYTVTLAVDGLDALDKLRAQTYDLVVSDVEMPHVDGFQLTSRIRRDLGHTALPVIIMTSLASDDHRRRGLAAGAQAYIVKSQFNQDNLLEVIQQLLGSEMDSSM